MLTPYVVVGAFAGWFFRGTNLTTGQMVFLIFVTTLACRYVFDLLFSFIPESPRT